MEGTSRRIAIIVLSILLAILVIVAVAIFLNSRNRAVIIVDGAACQPGAAAQCETASAGGNTGQLCSCVTNNGISTWQCDSLDTASCPTNTGTSCQPNEQQVGSCGASGCGANQKPVQSCGADGRFGAVSCVTDATCGGSGSTTSASLNCEISGDNKELAISTNCPTDFSYLVKLHEVAIPTATSDADCAIAFDENAQVFNGEPGSKFTIDTTAYACGLCVRYVLTQTPTSAFIKASSVYAFTGVCEGTTSSETETSTESSSLSSTPVSSANSTPAGELPDTGLFDDPNNLPLLFGLTMILLGLSFNRVIWLWKGEE